MELAAYNSYEEVDFEINYWRTKSGLEVDFVLAKGEVAIEVKGSHRIDRRDLRPLLAFMEEYSPRAALVVCNVHEEAIHHGIRIIPWQGLLTDLWAGRII